MSPLANDYAVELVALNKNYGSTTVVKDCSITFHGGEIHALLGANGAGKSTLVRMMAGLVKPSRGQMRVAGKPYTPANKKAAENVGIEIVQQELNLIPTLSVAENLFLSRMPTSLGIIHQAALHRHARIALDRFGLNHVSSHTELGSLGVGQQQMVEIAAALDRKCKLLILDEPTAALSTGEAERLFEWLAKLRTEGVGIVYISHRLDEIRRLSDRCTVLRDGKLVGTVETSNTDAKQLVQLMSGDEGSRREHRSHVSDEIVLRAENVSGGIVKDVSLTLKRGERLGIAGLVGSGRTELLRMLFGADASASGALTINGKRFERMLDHPEEAVRHRIAMVTEDRKANGLLLSKSISFNASLASLGRKFSVCGLIKHNKVNRHVQEQVKSLEIRCEHTHQAVGKLSGGNQQKVAIAKWLECDAQVLLFDEPTRGIDVAARNRIYQLMDAMSHAGKSLLIVSSDTEELLENCDRIAVMSNGRIAATFERGKWTHEAIMQAAFSGYLDRKASA